MDRHEQQREDVQETHGTKVRAGEVEWGWRGLGATLQTAQMGLWPCSQKGASRGVRISLYLPP